jgi:zinc transport system permease protein
MSIDTFLAMFQYDFMQRAFLVGGLLAAGSSALGVFLILRRYALIGDGLAHVSFATTALAVLLGVVPLLVNIPLVIAAAFGIQFLHRHTRIHSDAAIGVVSSISVALGVLMASVFQGFNIDIKSYLFGNILLINQMDVWISAILSIFVLVLVLVFRHDLMSISFDEDFAHIQGVPVRRTNAILTILTAVTISIGMRVVGTMLISSLILLPGLAALQLSRSFKQALVIAGALSISGVFIGILFSYVLAIPSGASIVLINGLFFGLSVCIRWIRNQK